MKKNIILTFALIILSTFAFQTAAAQFTITLPKIPKIKKPKVQQPAATPDGQPAVQDQRSEQKTSSHVSDDGEQLGPIAIFELNEIAKVTKDVSEYTPEGKIYLVDAIGAEWLMRAVSPREREKWMTRLNTVSAKKKFNEALDGLAAAAAKKLPSYKGDLDEFEFRNPAEEKLMRTELTRIANYKIYKTGLAQAHWLIDKDNFGLPRARYKSGAFWIRDTTEDHPYCTITYVNIIQDYAGGGTYAASYTQFIKDKLIGCPASAY